MIKLFSKIRHNLMNENKISKYVKYALGEILLVVIGILIALQINNWNEQRKIEIDLQNSLAAMIVEIEKNIDFLTNQKAVTQTRVDGLKRIFDKSASLKDKQNILNFFGPDVNSKPFLKVFEVMKEDKKLGLIENKELVNNINEFFEYTLPDIHEFCKWHEGFVGNVIDPYIIENIPIKRNDVIDLTVVNKLLENIKFNNILSYQNILYSGYIQASSNAIERAKKLRVELTTELERLQND